MVGEFNMREFIYQMRPAIDAATEEECLAQLHRIFRPRRGPLKSWRARRKVRTLLTVIEAGPANYKNYKGAS